MVGSAIVRALTQAGHTNIITASREELDLRGQASVRTFFERSKPEYVILAAAIVGGIEANRSRPVEFLRDNLQIQNNVIDSSYAVDIKKLVFLGSSCIYPRETQQPMREEYLLTGPLEPTNEGYALAKIAGLRLAQYYQRQYGMECLIPIPCNLYGPNDSFDPKNAHVLSANVRRFVDAAKDNIPEVTVWGTGSAKREFMHVDDLARALLFLMDAWKSPEVINVGTGVDLTIKELVELIAQKAEYKGRIIWDATKPDGMPRKCMDISKLAKLGFKPTMTLEHGIEQMINDYRTKATTLSQ
jgi:GDP-L-fucose synthase